MVALAPRRFVRASAIRASLGDLRGRVRVACSALQPAARDEPCQAAIQGIYRRAQGAGEGVDKAQVAQTATVVLAI